MKHTLKHWLIATCLGLAISPLATAKQLTIGISQEFENLNPVISQMMASKYIYYMVGHPLISINADWQWQCWLCVSVPSLENKQARISKEKGKEVLLVDWEIRKDAKWGDGKPITGNDVKLSWQIGLDPAVSVGEKDIYMRIADISVDKKNPRKFTMKFKEPRYDFYQLGTFYIMPEHIEGKIFKTTKGKTGAYEKQTTYTTNPTNPGLYSGPYLVKEIKLGSHVILDRNPHYYGKKPDIDRIIFKLIPNTQTLEANLMSGTIDMVAELGMTFDQALAFEKRLKRDASLRNKYQVLFEEGMTYEHIDLQLNNPILQDIRVRKALILSADREKLSQALFEGRQKVAHTSVHPKDIYYTDQITKYKFDPEQAKALLKEAGWKAGKDGILAKDGKKLSFTLMTTAQNKTRELVQVYLQEQWKRVGIEININNEPARVFFGETVRKGNYKGMAMFAWISSPDNPPRSILHSDEIPTKANGYSGQNSNGWKNATVDKLLNEIYKEFDVKKRQAMMTTIQQEYTKELPTIPLYIRSEISVIPTNLKGFKMTGHQFSSTLRADEWVLK